MKNANYRLIKFLFGLFIILLGIRNFLDLEENKNLMLKYVNKLEYDMNYHMNFIKEYMKENYKELKDFNFINHTFNFNIFRENVPEIILSSSFITIIGGILMLYGYSMASAYVMYGFLIEFLFLHNYYFFKEEKMKVNVLKLIAVFGGLMHWG